MTSQTNAQLREKANTISAALKVPLGLVYTPKCDRITRRRGYGHAYRFSVPRWAAADPSYFAYYVAHEVCHGDGLEHGARFQQRERRALAVLGMEPIYKEGSPYIGALKDVATGALLVCCVAHPSGVGVSRLAGPPDFSPVETLTQNDYEKTTLL